MDELNTIVFRAALRSNARKTGSGRTLSRKELAGRIVGVGDAICRVMPEESADLERGLISVRDVATTLQHGVLVGQKSWGSEQVRDLLVILKYLREIDALSDSAASELKVKVLQIRRDADAMELPNFNVARVERVENRFKLQAEQMRNAALENDRKYRDDLAGSHVDNKAKTPPTSSNSSSSSPLATVAKETVSTPGSGDMTPPKKDHAAATVTTYDRSHVQRQRQRQRALRRRLKGAHRTREVPKQTLGKDLLRHEKVKERALRKLMAEQPAYALGRPKTSKPTKPTSGVSLQPFVDHGVEISPSFSPLRGHSLNGVALRAIYAAEEVAEHEDATSTLPQSVRGAGSAVFNPGMAATSSPTLLLTSPPEPEPVRNVHDESELASRRRHKDPPRQQRYRDPNRRPVGYYELGKLEFERGSKALQHLEGAKEVSRRRKAFSKSLRLRNLNVQRAGEAGGLGHRGVTQVSFGGKYQDRVRSWEFNAPQLSLIHI